MYNATCVCEQASQTHVVIYARILRLLSQKIVFYEPYLNRERLDMDLSSHLQTLLYRTDCVILPRIGGFVAQYKPASIDFLEQRIYPPRKQISFNPKLLNEDDRVLCDFLRHAENLDEATAQQRVEAYILQLENELLEKSYIELPEIGRLEFQHQRGLIFTPDATNFLAESFGLQPIDCRPVLRSKEKLANPELASMLMVNTERAPQQRKKRLWLWLSLALLLLFIPLGIYIKNKNNPQPLSQHTPPTTDTLAQTNPPVVEEDSIATVPAVDTPVQETPQPEPTPQPEEPQPTVPTGECIIVLGAFEIDANAQRLMDRLETAGYTVDTKTMHQGWQRIGVRVSCEESVLNEHLSAVRKAYSEKAWVVK